jgi:TRIAD3 protein (E3 ubiquitin-protein ligase RNF216)
MEPLMGPGNDQLPNHALAHATEPILVDREPSLPVHTAESEVTQEPDERLVERVREIVPDVLPSHVFELLAQHKIAFADNLLDVVIHTLLEDPSYPKDIKGKGKERAAEKKLAEILGDNNMSIDYTHPNADRPVGPAYRGLSLVCANSPLFCELLTCPGTEISLF